MVTARRLIALLILAVGCTACADDSGAGTPTPYVAPAPPSRSAVIYVLGQKLVPGYQRVAVSALNPTGLASENALPSLAGELRGDGFLTGARAEYAPPKGSPTPSAFNRIASDAILFDDAAGAARYFSAQTKRIDTAGAGATIAAIPGLPREHVEALVAYQSALPAPAGAEVDLAFIALLRLGRVVAQVFARGASLAMTQVAAFVPLVAGQESLLAVPPSL